jgi:DNA-binding NarL/FixJ family response regulator
LQRVQKRSDATGIYPDERALSTTKGGKVMEKDYKDLLIQLLLEKLHKEKSSTFLTASSVVTKPRKKVLDRHKWTREQKIEMLRLNSEGVSESVIAERLGLRRQQVEAMIYSIKAGRASL